MKFERWSWSRFFELTPFMLWCIISGLVLGLIIGIILLLLTHGKGF